MKLAIGIIVFNTDFVLYESIKAIYPYADQILIAEGPVTYYQNKGFATSTDKTNEIIDNFPDPDNKIIITHGQYKEKADQSNAFMKYLDADYLWLISADEIYKSHDIIKLKKLMVNHSSVSFCCKTFFGGFSHVMTGFEAKFQQPRIFRVKKGSIFSNHRPPQINNVEDDTRHLGRDLKKDGIFIYHYSYVWERQVREKMMYYKDVITDGNFIEGYFEKLWLPWVNGTSQEREAIEQKYMGVHEFLPSYRGECFTELFDGHHPIDINNLYINK